MPQTLGLSIRPATNGAMPLERARLGQHELIPMSMRMPTMDSTEAHTPGWVAMHPYAMPAPKEGT